MPYSVCDRIALLLPLLGCASAFSSTARLLPTRRSAVMTAERTAADFCRTSPHAVIVTVWPRPRPSGQRRARWVEDCGGKILHDAEGGHRQARRYSYVPRPVLGEDWLETNCWYGESPCPRDRPTEPQPVALEGGADLDAGRAADRVGGRRLRDGRRVVELEIGCESS